MNAPLSRKDLALLDAIRVRRARDNFWEYRLYMNPTLKVGWWQHHICVELQQFYEAWAAGLSPALIIQAPPQHGKSTIINDFICWWLGKHPDKRCIFGSYAQTLGNRANRYVLRTIQGDKYRRVFPGVAIPTRADKAYTVTRQQLDILDHLGCFRNTTVKGSITGESLDMGVIDDPIKGREEASSIVKRDRAWEWFTDDFFTRFAADGALLMILTRWHVDDPAGRLQEARPNIRVVSYPAIAVEDEEFRKAGEALFPEHKPLDFLLERKAVLLPDSWESLYQQSPFIRSGGLFPVDRFNLTHYLPPRDRIAMSVRYWDKAGTKDGDGAETAGVLMHRMVTGQYVVEHVAHGRWAMKEREDQIRLWAHADGHGVHVYVEQEPGSGGKDSAEYTIGNLAGFQVYADRPSGDKAVRAEPFAAQVQGGNVWLCDGPWRKPYLLEHEQFPNGKLKDMVDASTGAFSKLFIGDYDMEALTR